MLDTLSILQLMSNILKELLDMTWCLKCRLEGDRAFSVAEFIFFAKKRGFVRKKSCGGIDRFKDVGG